MSESLEGAILVVPARLGTSDEALRRFATEIARCVRRGVDVVPWNINTEGVQLDTDCLYGNVQLDRAGELDAIAEAAKYALAMVFTNFGDCSHHRAGTVYALGGPACSIIDKAHTLGVLGRKFFVTHSLPQPYGSQPIEHHPDPVALGALGVEALCEDYRGLVPLLEKRMSSVVKP